MINIFSEWSIRKKLIIIYTFLIILFVGLLNIFSYLGFVRIIRDQAFHYTAGIMEQVKNNIDSSLNGLDKASYLIFSNPMVLEALGTNKSLNELESRETYNIIQFMNDVMGSTAILGQSIFSITLYDNLGNEVKTNPYSKVVTFEEIKDRADRGDGKLVFLGQDEILRTLVYARKVYSETLKPLGYLRFDIHRKIIENAFSEEIHQMEGLQYILNESEFILVSSPLNDIQNELRDFILGKVDTDMGLQEVITPRGHELMVIQNSSFNNWQFVCLVPISRLISEAQLIRRVTLISSIVSVLLFTFFSYFVIRQYTKPIHQIAEEMKNVQLRDWLPSITYKGNDEISYLTDQFNSMTARLKDLAEELVEERTRFHKQQVDTLMVQINPHFLYNTLEVVNWMARANQVPEIAEIIKAISGMMRYSLKQDTGYVSLKDELTYIQEYLYIQKVRFEDKFEVKTIVDEECLEIQIPKLILQPLIENSILHGFKGIKHKGLICLKVQKEAGSLRLVIEDNGRGMKIDPVSGLPMSRTADSNQDHHGMGLNNINQRIRLIYGKNYGMTINSSEGQGSQICLLLPCNSIAKEKI